MFGGQAVFCACLDLLFRLPRRVPFASVQKEPKDSPRHPAPAASRLGCPRCIVAPGGTPPRSFMDRGGSRGILPLVPLRNDSARPPDGAGLPPHHLEGKPHFVHARNPIRRADNRKRLFTLRIRASVCGSLACTRSSPLLKRPQPNRILPLATSTACPAILTRSPSNRHHSSPPRAEHCWAVSDSLFKRWAQ